MAYGMLSVHYRNALRFFVSPNKDFQANPVSFINDIDVYGIYHLCRFARLRLISAFILAEPEPCEPVIYFFFFALVFTFVSVVGLSFLGPPRKVMPLRITWLISSPPGIIDIKSMMEQSYTGKGHCNAILVACVDDMVITHTSASLGNIFYSTLMGTLYVVSEWEECIAT